MRPGCYWSICLYLGLMGVGYLLIEPLGFYAATFLCIVAMTAYGTFWLSGRKADLRGIVSGTGLFAAPHRRRVRLFLTDHGSTDPHRLLF